MRQARRSDVDDDPCEIGRLGACAGQRPTKATPAVSLPCVRRTLAWLNRFRRLIVRHERHADIHQAFVILGCALNGLNQIRGSG
jgi:hypothetical protein